MKEDILKLVEETFDEEIFTSHFESILGIESVIEGKDEFMKKISIKLKKLFDENNLYK